MADHALKWIDEGSTEALITEREFVITGGKKPVPGILWTPESVEKPLPLVLFGHQGSSHKRVSEALMLAHRFAGAYQFAFAAIDGPVHGGREVPGDYAAAMADGGVDNVIDGMVADWTATQEQLSRLDQIDGNQVAYIGFSMGARFGIPYTAAAGDRLRCSVVGKNGLQSNDEALARASTGPRFTRDAPRIKVPVLFHMQWDDQLYLKETQCDLFDLIGSEDKRLISYPGPHARSTPEAVDHWCRFIASHLRA